MGKANSKMDGAKRPAPSQPQTPSLQRSLSLNIPSNDSIEGGTNPTKSITGKKSSKNLMDNFNNTTNPQGHHVLAAKRSSRALHSNNSSDFNIDTAGNNSPYGREQALSPGRLPGRGDGTLSSPSSNGTSPRHSISVTSAAAGAAYSHKPYSLPPQPPPQISPPPIRSTPATSKPPVVTGNGGLFGRKAPISSSGASPANIALLRLTVELTRACIKGDLETIKTLIPAKEHLNGVDLNIVDKNGGTFVMYAAMGNHYAVVRYLIDLGAMPDRQNEVSTIHG